MKKILKLLLFIIIIISISSACSANLTLKEKSLCRYVVQTDIICSNNGKILHRRYMQDEKIEDVLLYFRMLKTRRKISKIPEGNCVSISGISGELSKENSEISEENTEYEILLTFSDGSQKIYRQKGNRYLSVNDGCWEVIMPKQGHRLSKIFKLLPSDS